MLPLNSPRLAIFKENHSITFIIYIILFILNYSIMRKIARQRGTSTTSLEIGLWVSWVAGPFITADFFVLAFIHLSERDFGSMNRYLSTPIIIGFTWLTVRKAEREGWEKVDPKGPKSLSDALRK